MVTTKLIGFTLAAALTLALAPEAASADPANLEISAGLGFKVISTQQCGDAGEWGCIDGTTHTIIGAAPVGGVGWIKRTHRKRGWQFRFGPEVVASVIGDQNESGVSLGAVMKVGFHFRRLHGEIGYGASTLTFKARDIEARSAGVLLHYAGGIELDESWALRGKIDAHMMVAQQEMFAVVVAGGLVYSP